MKHVGAAMAAALLAAGLVACSGPPAPPVPGAGALPPATGAQRLDGVCPATVVFQEGWEPQAEEAARYQLLAGGYTIDAAHKQVSGPLVAGGRDTGVRVEIRAGGPAVAFATTQARMYLDKSIMLGEVPTDRAIATSADQPVISVVSTLVKSPQMLMWDPVHHPDWRGAADIGASGAKVVVARDNTFMPLLTAKGLIKPAQVDTGYTGAPTRFVTDPTIAQQGYATADPYIYQHEVPAWGKPVRYQLLADLGYSVYPGALSVRSGDLAALAPCLRRLVPILQQAQLDYLREPGPANHVIVDAATRYNDGWTYSTGVADYAAATMRRLGIVADDSSGALGGQDPARVQPTIDTLGPILAASGANVKPDLKAADIATNQFIDPSIKLR
jgi:hypothetical protein